MKQEQNPHDKRYDVVVIGAGMGGLLSGALLAREGYKVAVLEKNKQVGGSLQSFGVDKKRFESAVHYIGSLAPGQTLYKIFNYLGITGKLALEQLDTDCFDKIYIGGREFEMAQGYQNFIDTLSKQFPAQRKNLEQYILEIQYVCAHFPLYHLEAGDAEKKKLVSGIGLKEKMESLFDDPLLIQVLTANNMLYGGQYGNMPFYIHALIENSYIESSWKCSDGSMRIARSLQDIIHEEGGRVFANCGVTRIHESGGRVTHVSSSRGIHFYASYFISNLHPAISYQLLDSRLIKPVTKKRMDTIPSTMSAFMINISLKEQEVAYRNHNIYYHREDNVWSDLEPGYNEIPNSYAIFFYRDPLHPEFATGISILTYMHISRFREWEHTHRTTNFRESRGHNYEDEKSNMAIRYIEEVEKILPGLTAAIRKLDVCSPLTYRDYLNIPEGAMYGIRKDVDTLHLTSIATRTKIPNLFLTGQNINIHGILGVSITALLTVSELTGLEHILDRIHEKNRAGL